LQLDTWEAIWEVDYANTVLALIYGTQDFNYLIRSNSWNEWIFEKKLTILIVQVSNFYFPLHNLSRSCYDLLTPWNLQSALSEGDRRHPIPE